MASRLFVNYIHGRTSLSKIWLNAITSIEENIFKLTFSTHWGRVTHICVGKLTIIASDNGLWPGRRQAIIWTNAGILLIEPLGTNISETLIAIHTFPFKKIQLKMSSGKWRPSCLGLNVLKCWHFYSGLNVLSYCDLMTPWRHRTWLTLVQVMVCCLTAQAITKTKVD